MGIHARRLLRGGMTQMRRNSIRRRLLLHLMTRSMLRSALWQVLRGREMLLLRRILRMASRWICLLLMV